MLEEESHGFTLDGTIEGLRHAFGDGVEVRLKIWEC